MEEENNINQNVTVDESNKDNIGVQYESQFKVSNNSNLPIKTTFFTNLKRILFSEIKIQLIPYEQKIENEINEFLHQEITWQGFKNFLFKEVEITHKGKRIL